MKVAQILPFLVALASAVAVPAKVSYDGAKVVRVFVGDDVAGVERIMKQLSLSSREGQPRENEPIDLVVPAAQVQAFEMDAATLDTEVLNEDLGASIALESAFEPYEAGNAPNITWFNSYHTYDDHMAWLTDVQATYSANSEVFELGDSSEGRPLSGIHIYGRDGPSTKPAIVFHGTIHAREWITTMTVEYMIYQLLSLYATDEQVKTFVDSYDFYIVPIANPDGFVYTQTTERFWRKNRQINNGTDCVGTDNNRNWDAFWDVPGGSSPDPCTDVYRGASPGSSPETNAHMEFLLARSMEAGGLKLFVDWHSFSQLVLSPWGYSCNETFPDTQAHDNAGQAFADGVAKSFNTQYTVGPTCQTLYAVSGGSADFAYSKAEAEYAYVIELRDTGTFGFDLPPDQILPTGIETFEGLRAMLAAIS